MLVNGHLKRTGHLALVAINLTVLIPGRHYSLDSIRLCKVDDPSCKNLACDS